MLGHDSVIEKAIIDRSRRVDINKSLIEAKRQELQLAKMEAYRQQAEKLEEEETACMNLEDTTAKL